jgi:hypothetical protein
MQSQDDIAKAEQLHLAAQFRYNEINAHIKVYGTRNAETKQLARNGIEFVEAALKIVPDSPAYLNTYALLIIDGLGDTKLGLEILLDAAQLAPDDIQIQQNIRDIHEGGRVKLIVVVAGVIVIVFLLAVLVATVSH